MNGVKIEIPGVEVKGTFKPWRAFEAIANFLSQQYGKKLIVTATPSQQESA